MYVPPLPYVDGDGWMGSPEGMFGKLPTVVAGRTDGLHN